MLPFKIMLSRCVSLAEGSITALNITRIYLIIKVTTAGNQAPHCHLSAIMESLPANRVQQLEPRDGFQKSGRLASFLHNHHIRLGQLLLL